MNTYVKTNGELYHHGVLGQKWGVKNGPPYPLKPSAHSASEKKAGWTKSVSGDAKKKKAKTGGFKEFATRNDPIVKWDQKRKAEKEAKNSGKTGKLSEEDFARVERSSSRKAKNAVETYKKADADLREKKANNDKSRESREAIRAARTEKKAAERRAKELLRAEEGRALYAQGKTVSTIQRNRYIATALAIGANSVGVYLQKEGYQKAGAIVSASSIALDLGYQIYAANQQKKLRAYYAYS